MTTVDARFYDGKSTQQRKVTIYSESPHHLRVVGEGVDFSCALSEVRPSSRVGNTPRHLYFADGSQCETEDNDAVDEILSGAHTATFDRLLHRWESRLGYVLIALVITAASLWAGVTYGIPALAKQVAFGLPAATDRIIGQDALEGLDQAFLEPTRLPPKRQTELKALFSHMVTDIPGATDYRIELRSSKMIGANALALPSGIVVVTDALVELASNDDELIAVLAHEIGHLRQRHSLRQMLQNSAMVLVFVAVTGDISSVMSLGAALPAMLVQFKYSRDFEKEADDFAFDYLKRHDIPAGSLTAILVRIDKKTGASGNSLDFLSTHPATQERVDRSRGQ